MNAIAVYAGAWILECLLTRLQLNGAIAGAFVRVLGDPYLASLAYALAFATLWWLVALALDRSGVRIRV